MNNLLLKFECLDTKRRSCKGAYLLLYRCLQILNTGMNELNAAYIIHSFKKLIHLLFAKHAYSSVFEQSIWVDIYHFTIDYVCTSWNFTMLTLPSACRDGVPYIATVRKKIFIFNSTTTSSLHILNAALLEAPR